MSENLYMQRCIELAKLGLGNVLSNPLVGSIIVHQNQIIGEGYHERYGAAHAEVNAIRSVIDKSLLKKSTLYVNLEPCSHHGKTPPCANLILEHQIPHVVIGMQDPNPLVAGRGIQLLQDKGVNVDLRIQEEACLFLNRRFITFQTKKRPYIILKWAETLNGYLAPSIPARTQISNELSKRYVHRWRAEEAAILVGSKTASVDDPELTVRYWTGKNPVRILLDRSLLISKDALILNESSPTLVFNEQRSFVSNNIEYVKIDFSNYEVQPILEMLYQKNIQSVIIEGGASVLNSFIQRNLWDEARIIRSQTSFSDGIKAPTLPMNFFQTDDLGDNQLIITYNT